MEQPRFEQRNGPDRQASVRQGTSPPAVEDQDDVMDAEIVETDAGDNGAVRPDSAFPAGDYSEAGVPSLEYLRSKIEGRLTTAGGAGELATAAAERESATEAAGSAQQVAAVEQRRAAAEQAAKDRLDEIRRSIRPGS